MDIAFLITAVVILAGAAGAMALRNLVHCALCGAASFAGLAAAFLQLHAEFAGFAQLLVYVGAVAILIVITLMLTRSFAPGHEALAFKPWTLGIGIAGLVAGAVISAIVSSPLAQRATTPAPAASVKAIGDVLMSRYLVPLEVLGLLLTAALIGAVVLALKEGDRSAGARPKPTTPE